MIDVTITLTARRMSAIQRVRVLMKMAVSSIAWIAAVMMDIRAQQILAVQMDAHTSMFTRFAMIPSLAPWMYAVPAIILMKMGALTHETTQDATTISSVRSIFAHQTAMQQTKMDAHSHQAMPVAMTELIVRKTLALLPAQPQMPMDAFTEPIIHDATTGSAVPLTAAIQIQ